MKNSTLLIILLNLIVLSGYSQDWIKQQSNTSSDLTSVYFVNAKLGFVVGSSGTILKTTDGGTQWQIKPSGTTNNLLSVCFVDSLNGFTLSAKELFKTIDGGENWFLQDTTTNHSWKHIQFVGQDTGFVAGMQILLKTTDKGASWIKQRSVNVNTSFWAINSNELYKTGEDFLIVKSTDSGEHWELSRNFSCCGVFYDLFFTDQNVGYAGGGGFAQGYFYGWLLKTTNGGLDWSESWRKSLYLEGGNSVQSIFFVNANTGYAATNGGKIIKTTDAGKNWIDLVSGVNLSLESVFFPESTTGYVVGAKGTILKAVNVVDGIKTNSNSTKFKIFPNPIFDNITIETEFIKSDTELSLFNINGQKLFAQQIVTPKTQVHLSMLKKGLYIVKITTKENVETFKIVIQ